jgi:hypothetical protein
VTTDRQIAMITDKKESFIILKVAFDTRALTVRVYIDKKISLYQYYISHTHKILSLFADTAQI